jgi:putative OPT family oligopeptide transporter
MEHSYIPANQQLPELTVKAIILSIILAAVLAASNVYIGLKIGLIVSASIPAAVISMVLFRFSKQSNVLENNIVQTGASASASIASGVVFVLPALLLIQFWHQVNYWETIFICIVGGTLGILFSIPLRRALLKHSELKFPEGVAIAEVLKVNAANTSLKDLFIGGFVASLIQLCQQGFAVLANSYNLWFTVGRTILGLGIGFDITMVGAGYIIGFNVGLSILMGAIIGWILGVPVLSFFIGVPHRLADVTDFVMKLWSTQIRYIGIGAMLVGGIWSLIVCIKPIIASLKLSTHISTRHNNEQNILPRTERDIPMKYVGIGMIVLLLLLAFYLFHEMQVLQLELAPTFALVFYGATLIYIIVAGFIFSAITAYFSGLIGMSASPVSAVNIAILIILALLLDGLLIVGSAFHATGVIVLHAAAITILVTTVLACAAAMSNGTIQDLKTGAILGATPWKLQVVLIIGVIVSTAVVPPIIELLFNTYGIGDVFPRAGMNAARVLGAPQASLIAAVAKGVFFHDLPFNLIFIGVVISGLLIIVNQYMKRYGKSLSVVAFAMGIYLPMSVTVPLFFGSLISYLVIFRQKQQLQLGLVTETKKQTNSHNVVLSACGLVAGGSLMGLLLSVPFAIYGNTGILNLVTNRFALIAAILSMITTLLVGLWMYKVGTRK